MRLTTDQKQTVVDALRPKLKNACPTCGESNQRTLLDLMFLMPLHPPPDVTENAQLKFGDAPHTAPCVVTTCNNCGLTETYNIHILGLAKFLGIPPPSPELESGELPHG